MVRNVANKAVQRNTFFAHSDKLLLPICTDEDEAIRRDFPEMAEGYKTKSSGAYQKVQNQRSEGV